MGVNQPSERRLLGDIAPVRACWDGIQIIQWIKCGLLRLSQKPQPIRPEVFRLLILGKKNHVKQRQALLAATACPYLCLR